MLSFKDKMSEKMFGRIYSECVEKNICVMCGSNVIIFNDNISKKEYYQSGICPICQDEIFKSKT